MDDLEKTIALMGISESVTIGHPTLALVHAALVREAAARPVLDAATAWVRHMAGSRNACMGTAAALIAAVDTYRAALAAPVEAGIPAQPDSGETAGDVLRQFATEIESWPGGDEAWARQNKLAYEVVATAARIRADEIDAAAGAGDYLAALSAPVEADAPAVETARDEDAHDRMAQLQRENSRLIAQVVAARAALAEPGCSRDCSEMHTFTPPCALHRVLTAGVDGTRYDVDEERPRCELDHGDAVCLAVLGPDGSCPRHGFGEPSPAAPAAEPAGPTCRVCGAVIRPSPVTHGHWWHLRASHGGSDWDHDAEPAPVESGAPVEPAPDDDAAARAVLARWAFLSDDDAHSTMSLAAAVDLVGVVRRALAVAGAPAQPGDVVIDAVAWYCTDCGDRRSNVAGVTTSTCCTACGSTGIEGRGVARTLAGSGPSQPTPTDGGSA